MPDGRFIADTLETVIVGLAESLTEAQEALGAMPPLDSAGRPVPQYRLPHLDFEIGFRLVTETRSSGSAYLYFLPVSSSSSSSEVTSKVSGRFVALPPGEGMPLPVLGFTATGTGAERELAVRASNSAGELLAGATVQLNIDLAASQALSTSAGIADPRIAGNATLEEAVLLTDSQGRASTRVRFGNALRTAAVVLITAELGSTVARLTTGKEI